MEQLTRQGVAESDIAVLSQYRAQHKMLQSNLQQYSRVTVSTVAAAQGLHLLLLVSQRSRGLIRFYAGVYKFPPKLQLHNVLMELNC